MAEMPNNDNDYKSTSKCRSVWNAIECRRNVLAFWIFGMATNFIFIISLSAAHDILDPKNDDKNDNTGKQRNSSQSGNNTKLDDDDEDDILFCNPQGTGLVLICSILPELILKIVVQFTPKDIPYCFKVGVTVISGVACFILFAYGDAVWIRLIGVVCSGIAFGLGETTFVPLTSFYEKSTVSSWSSGTGSAGLSATLLYAALTSLGVARSTFMMAMLVVPVIMALSYMFLLKPDVVDTESTIDLENKALVKKSDSSESLTLKERLKLVPSLLKYLVPLSVAYVTVYFINQGLIELLYFNGQFISREEQYRWYQVVYRIGVFIARVGLRIMICKNLWMPPFLLCGLVGLLTFQVFYRFIPYLWIIMVLVFFEGFINGVAYVSNFMHVTENVDSVEREFTLGMITLSGPIGIFLAGVTATPFHNLVCSMDLHI